ncbi:MAG: hypothetical protein AOA66_1102 [Candidatus Bathyarchaeota archaeon BA2]|nr:MAG: hypothetical protein AOA66_1102 [Candidatus Bathyarchaeota archaeon BA2]
MGNALVRIVVSKFGEVDNESIDKVIEAMEECYSRLAPHEVSLVDLYVFERSASVEAFLTKESREVGVVSAPFDELFFAMHDAWRGTPRIFLCFERMQKLPGLVRIGGIRHEVGHSVLHGSLHYYLLPFPTPLLEIAGQFNLSFEYIANLLYLISIAVKDYEVSRLLYRRGYVEDQVAYAKHLLKVSENDILSWEISRGKPPAEALCLISCLKATGCAAPLLIDKKIGGEINRHLMESLSYLPADLSVPLLKVISEGFPSLEKDTLDNIDRMVRECRLIFETVFNR